MSTRRLGLKRTSGFGGLRRPAYKDAILGDGAAGYWRQSEISGTTMRDSSGNGRNGTYSSGVSLAQASLLTSDTADYSAFYTGNGSTGLAQVAHASWMDTPSITIEAIIKPTVITALPMDFLVQDDDASPLSELGWRLFLAPSSGVGKLSVYLNTNVNNRSLQGAASIVVNQRVHAAFSFDNTTKLFALYADGVQVAQSTLTGETRNLSTQGLSIGKLSTWNAEIYTGYVDEVAWYSTALSAAQIALHSQVS